MYKEGNHDFIRKTTLAEKKREEKTLSKGDKKNQK